MAINKICQSSQDLPPHLVKQKKKRWIQSYCKLYEKENQKIIKTQRSLG